MVKIHRFIILLIVLILNIFQGHSQLYINEFMARNKTGLTDNKGKFADWIEIFNGGDKVIDIGGYYLTDTLGNPGRSKIKSSNDSTLIKPHGYIVFFADGKTKNGVLHLSFKLKKAGEQIGLYKKEGERFILVDAITYKEQYKDVSYGRIPDGGKKLAYILTPSPGATNDHSTTGRPPVRIKNSKRPSD